ncbi:CASP8 protein, partial [Turnix velox]|nr:CASP8 protein [Turnix velox]
MELPRQQLLVIAEELGQAELAALKFLSLEHIPMRKLEAIQKAQDFFEALSEKGMIEAGNLSFLKELLYHIGRIDLLTTHLGSSREEMAKELQLQGRAKVSAYRCLLFQLSEDITQDELKAFMFLLGKQLPKCKLAPMTTMLDLFIEMEKKGILRKDYLNTLKCLCEEIKNINLLKRIQEYESNLTGEEEMHITEEHGGKTGGPEGNGNSKTPRRGWNNFTKCLSSQQLEAYKMTSRPRGICVIMNNHSFAKAREAVPVPQKLKDRDGTDVDAAALKRVFSKLHFEIQEHKDLTAEEILKTVNIYQCKDHTDKDCFVCCILSHGNKGIIYGADGQEVSVQKLTTSFTGRNCRSLSGKPKVFFIQACQGDAYQQSVTVETDSGEQDSLEMDARPQLDCIPAEADFLLGMATLPGHVSFRSQKKGTWYIQALCKHLDYSCPRGEDILTILTAVNEEVSKKTCMPYQVKQMPQPSFTLRKKLIFPIN